jgi:hypothetical protein
VTPTRNKINMKPLATPHEYHNTPRHATPHPERRQQALLPTMSTKRAAPYTAAEKQWLKDEWRDEYHFLRAYRLSIYKDEDREEGRAIVRAYIREDDEDRAEGGLPTADDYAEAPRDEGPVRFEGDDIAYQMAEMHVGEEYGLDSGEHGDDQEDGWEEGAEYEEEEVCMDYDYDEYYGEG